MTVRKLIVTEDESGMRLDRWFRRREPKLSLAHLNKLVRKGEIRIDGARAKISTRVAAGQAIRVPPLRIATDSVASPALKRAPDFEHDARELRAMILFEDRDLVVLNKPYGLAVQGGSGTTRHIDGMLASLAGEKGEQPRLVHRLDRDTAGVLLVARTRRTAADLGEIFRSRQARKIYWAVVHGVPRPAQGRISLFLAKGPGMEGSRGASNLQPKSKERERMRVAQHGEDDAQHSVTFYAVVDKIAPRLAWLSMKPITGRTHQLRAHAEAIGHPIVGDPKYGVLASQDPRRADPMCSIPEGVQSRLHLVARRLVLPHPRGGILDVTAPLPPHMRQTWDMFGFDLKHPDPIMDAPNE